jgi:citrate lyase beta subunit
MYVPCDHPKLTEILGGTRYPWIHSLIGCTEDAVSQSRLQFALKQLAQTFGHLPGKDQGPDRFIRCRGPDVLETILAMEGVERVHGFVLPKCEIVNLRHYEDLLAGSSFKVMPTLETKGVFDPVWRRDIRQYLQASALDVLALRIGGNDLLRLLGMRRIRGVTTYETPLGLLIAQLMLEFRPAGFQLTAPVYDYFSDPATLAEEVARDSSMGLIGKTAIHPEQVPIIENGWKLSTDDIETAKEILTTRDMRGVFSSKGAMHEVSVHDRWAEDVVSRVRGDLSV